MFLGHIVGGGKLRNKSKVQAIQDWEPPRKVSEQRSFLGLVNYYRRFIKGYSSMAAPLTDLKKNRAWVWMLDAKMHSRYTLSDFSIGGVLMQESHPESRKLNDTERRYTVQEKEMTAVVHCLRTWRHYLLGSKFIVRYLFEPANRVGG
ncbi:UNVERIFIED_CONTAM: hypothetical protein Sangu_3071300 [Sesamum angustifolium]|uniref:Reverse transcriptase/retrotransposon-derived protein RNase H-like domain-containing protein n=1 Tax=Sesamum angustifolium TaxID=2727405 RepID=A0AAW2KFN8_9LAMI